MIIKKKNLQPTIHNLQPSSGFTFIELLTVMAVTIILSGIVLVNFRKGERNLALQRSAQIITQTINQAITSSLAGKRHPDAAGTINQGGFGIYIEVGASSVVLFADCDSEGDYDLSGSAGLCIDALSGAGSSYPEKVELKNLESNITISSITPCSGGPPCALNIVFLPPDPQAFFNNSSLAAGEASIQIQDTTGNTLIVKVNALGVTYIE